MSEYLICGGSGLVGRRLTTMLKDAGQGVKHLSRRTTPDSPTPTYKWDIQGGYIDPEAMANVDVIVNLAGADIFAKRWTASRKSDLYSSRVEANALLEDTLKNAKHSIRTFISASAQGYYQANTGQILTENEPSGLGFLAELCNDWELAAEEVSYLGIRVVLNRIGLVLSNTGGFLVKALPPVKMHLDTRFAKADQIFSWIHIDDLCRMIIHQAENNSLHGPFNAAAPEAVSQKEMNRAMASVLGKRTIPVPAPTFILRLVFGERYRLLTDSLSLSPKKIETAGFVFRFPDITSALEDLLNPTNTFPAPQK